MFFSPLPCPAKVYSNQHLENEFEVPIFGALYEVWPVSEQVIYTTYDSFFVTVALEIKNQVVCTKVQAYILHWRLDLTKKTGLDQAALYDVMGC